MLERFGDYCRKPLMREKRVGVFCGGLHDKPVGYYDRHAFRFAQRITYYFLPAGRSAEHALVSVEIPYPFVFLQLFEKLFGEHFAI